MKITTYPWAHHVIADALHPNDEYYSQFSKFQNYWGYEIEMIKTVAQSLNFTYELENPIDEMWGNIEPDGSWNGMINQVSKGDYDIAMSDIFISYGRSQVIL